MNIIRSGNSFSGGGMTGQFKYDFAGNLTWDFVYTSTVHASRHLPLPNGNVLLMRTIKNAAEATAG